VLTGDCGAGASPARSGKPRPGRELPADDHITYTVNERRSGEPPPPQLQAMPITVIKTASPPELRQLITVNSSYICYALNETKLRLLNKHTADKGPLLKDHTAGITDVRWRHSLIWTQNTVFSYEHLLQGICVQDVSPCTPVFRCSLACLHCVDQLQGCVLRRFHSDASNRLASAGKDGQLFAWQVGEDDGPIYAKQLLSLRVAANSSRMRLAWLSEDVVAFSAGSTVYLASIQLAGTVDTQVHQSRASGQYGTTCARQSA